MTLLTRVQVCVAAACVCCASSAVQAQTATTPGAAASVAARPAAASAVAAKGEEPKPEEAKAEEGKIETAGEDELVTDRPDFTESSEVVPRGGYQFESGINFETDMSDGVRGRSLSGPGSLLRIGLGGRTELRISGDGFDSEIGGGQRVTGFSDMSLGVKIRLFDQKQIGFDFAIIPMASIPTGADGFTSGHVDPTLKLTWARELPAGWGATGNFNFSSLSDEAGRFTQKAVSASFGHNIAGGWEGFAEVYSFTPMERGQGTGVTLDWGVARQIGHDLHFDIAAGHGLTPSAPDWFIGFGFAVRGRMADWR